jgi:hypothetical protein
MPRTVFVVVLAALLLVPSAAVASTSGVVVSQVYGGGGNSGALFRNDFVELFNAGTSSADLSGWSVQYATSAGTSWQTTPLSGSIGSGQYFLVQLASGGTVGAALPAPDATGTSNLAATSGKVALVHSTAPLTCGAAAGSCSGTLGVEDLVGYGDATDFEGSGTAAAPSSTLSALRADGGCADTGDNATDFSTVAPDPRNSAATAHLLGEFVTGPERLRPRRRGRRLCPVRLARPSFAELRGGGGRHDACTADGERHRVEQQHDRLLAHRRAERFLAA